MTTVAASPTWREPRHQRVRYPGKNKDEKEQGENTHDIHINAHLSKITARSTCPKAKLFKKDTTLTTVKDSYLGF